jgi:signal transduction histidine kinase
LFKKVFENENFLEYKKLFYMLESSAQRLTHFLLLAERITAFKTQRYKINPEVINLNSLIDDTLKSIENRLKEKNLKTEVDLSSEDKGDCYAEKQLIEICLFEILDNAIKYSDTNGVITINSYIKKDKYFIEIIDNGPGFSTDVLKNIFKPFISDKEISKQGMGLNLALIRLIIEAHSGNINIFNNENGGAKIQLTFLLYRK